jgi:crotonobetainyl-CoA:carnitine CoA-transferase CaiB-like acyl-CoA transferase
LKTSTSSARGNLARINDGELGEVVVPGVIPLLSATPGRISNLGPALGNATTDVLRDLLGMSAEEIARLRRRRII